MARQPRIKYTEELKAEIWRKYKKGESLWSIEMTPYRQLNAQTLGRSIPSFFILDCNVVRLRPRCSAAPSFPRIFQLHFSRTILMCARSTSFMVSPSRSWTGDEVCLDPECWENVSSSLSTESGERIMALSIMFLSSLTFPGQA